MALVPISGGVGSTTYTVSSGTITNITDGDGATYCVVAGDATSVPPFWYVDLGSERTVEMVIFRGLFEQPGTGDTGFNIRYSNSPFGTSAGTTFGNDLGAVPGSAGITGTQTGKVTARYWGIERAGNFAGNSLGLAELTMYEQPRSSGLNSKLW